VKGSGGRGCAVEPEELGRLFLEHVNAGDLDAVVALYETDAILVAAPGRVVVGHAAIRDFYHDLLATRPKFTGEVRAAVRHEDLALTSTRFAGGATAEIAGLPALMWVTTGES
jgi:ketosteroid isomerase-like protein